MTWFLSDFQAELAGPLSSTIDWHYSGSSEDGISQL